MVSLIRDYLDVLSSLSGSPPWELVPVTCGFVFQAFLEFCQYIFTFGWFRDILYLPTLLPKCQQAVLSEHFFYEDFNVPLFDSGGDLQWTPWKLFLLGTLNSLFFALPLSVTHFISIRRLFVQGPIAGLASTAGMVVGQCFFIFATLFGIRSLIIPWVSWDPWSYVLGIFLVFASVRNMAREATIRTVSVSEIGALRNMFVLSFLLTWTEQTSVSTYFSNLTLSNQVSPIAIEGLWQGQSSFASGAFQSGEVFACGIYFLGITVGHIFFSALVLAIGFFLKNALVAGSQLSYSFWIKRANAVLLATILGLSFSSLPYYSLDYLVTGPLGFISRDKTFEKSILTQQNINDPNRLLTSADVIMPFPIDADISYFDRGNYGEADGFFKRVYEELNFQGDYNWTVRRDRKPDLYASNQTTRSAVMEFLNGKRSDQTEQSEQETKQKEEEITEIEFIRLARNKAVQDEETAADQKQSPIRARLKNRFIELYEENVDNDVFLLGNLFLPFPLAPLPEPMLPVQQLFKQKYYDNQVYRTLLSAEIDAFIKRRPNEYQLTATDRLELARRQRSLAHYHDTIRDYQKVPYKNSFNQLFQGSKTFVDRAYKHQFKGTNSTVRRLFAVSSTAPLPDLQNKFYTNQSENQATADLTREFDFKGISKEKVGTLEFKPILPNLQYDQLLYSPQIDGKPLTGSSPFIHEEIRDSHSHSLRDLDADADKPRKQKPFMEINDASPFYFGWDNETRKMVLTKRFMPTSATKVSPPQGPVPEGNTFAKDPIVFSTWPLDQQSVMKAKSKINSKLITLFEPAQNPDMEAIVNMVNTDFGFGTIHWNTYAFPANMRFFGKPPERLAPNHGGFIWPGSAYMNP